MQGHLQADPVDETVIKCYTPVEKVCNGQGPEECRIVHQSSMWRNRPASLWEILPAKTCLWRSVEQAVCLKKVVRRGVS